MLCGRDLPQILHLAIALEINRRQMRAAAYIQGLRSLILLETCSYIFNTVFIIPFSNSILEPLDRLLYIFLGIISIVSIAPVYCQEFRLGSGLLLHAFVGRLNLVVAFTFTTYADDLRP